VLEGFKLCREALTKEAPFEFFSKHFQRAEVKLKSLESELPTKGSPEDPQGQGSDNTLDVQPKTIQAILRGARVETTTHRYVILEKQKAGDAATRKLERAVNYAANVQRAEK
jgi:hypothetical protein